MDIINPLIIHTVNSIDLSRIKLAPGGISHCSNCGSVDHIICMDITQSTHNASISNETSIEIHNP